MRVLTCGSKAAGGQSGERGLPSGDARLTTSARGETSSVRATRTKLDSKGGRTERIKAQQLCHSCDRTSCELVNEGKRWGTKERDQQQNRTRTTARATAYTSSELAESLTSFLKSKRELERRVEEGKARPRRGCRLRIRPRRGGCSPPSSSHSGQIEGGFDLR